MKLKNRKKKPSSVALYATLLLIGDSHTVASFGRKLDTLLRTVPDSRVASYASCGSTPYSWFSGWVTPCGYRERGEDGKVITSPTSPTPLIAELLKKHQPDVTLIALGANLFNTPFETSAKVTDDLVQTVAASGSKCIWIGPPDSRDRSGPKMDETYGILRGASYPECLFLDSRKWTHYPATGGDGTHYDHLGPEGVKISEAWAMKVFEAARPYLSGPPAN
jgi:hypothetical protein